ncbi:glycosyltransferase family 4 protein [Mucilaginibacter psychrotolerans]|uniref:Glycosyltransferase n=1 Tax=Mucilaginibacter psychrotolerans TaxID=1524096 RepID=A0A4Y8SJC3_9SPHI|nr:glycosyltransferase [Mucilaginibacter psychrotolerans]TFF38791.1 glycosyltransferase [Mucilaginibacter psychrotolerans]
MKKKIAYISPDYFADVDIPVIKSLCDIYQIHWIIAFDVPTKGYSKFATDELKQFAADHNITCDIMVKKFRRRNPLNIFYNISLIYKALKFKPDLFYIETLTDIYFSLMCFCFNRKRSVLAIHNVTEHTTAKRTVSDIVIDVSNYIERQYFTNVQLFSKSQAEIYKIKYHGKQIFVVPLFLKKFYNIEQLPNIETQYFYFLNWGTLRYNKGIDFLILAAEKLYKDGFKNFKVTIAGRATEEWEQWKSLIVHPEIFDLHIGSTLLPIEQIPALFSTAKFMVLPYRDVTQSGPLLYALNYSLPVIASALPGFEEYIKDGKNGYLFESENVESLFKAMKQAITLSPPSLVVMKDNLRGFVADNVSDKSIANKYQQMFLEILS